MSDNRRARTSAEKQRDLNSRTTRGVKRQGGMREIKGVITDFFLPGEESPSGLNSNAIRVIVDLDDDSQSYKDLRGLDILLEYSPHVSGMIHGSSGLIGVSCIVKGQLPNLSLNARAYLESVPTTEPDNDSLDTKFNSMLRQKVGSLTGALLS